LHIVTELSLGPARSARGTMNKVVIDRNPSQACKDFNLKLTRDVIALLSRNFDIMVMEIGPQEAINVALSVLALAGVTTATGGGSNWETFEEYVRIAGVALENGNERQRRAVHR
jgi:hypothetical protein